MATIAQVTNAAKALDDAAIELTKLVAERNRAQGQIDAITPSILALRQQVRQARDNLITLINEGIDV